MTTDYSPETLALDALAAAGIICRTCGSGTFDLERELLAQRHADLVDDLTADDVQLAASRIAKNLPQTVAAVQADILADQAALR